MSLGIRGQTLLLYWGSLATGMLLPLAADLAVTALRRPRELATYFDGFFIRLFAPGEGLEILTLLGGAPFALFAVLALLHLGTAPRSGDETVRRRRLGLLFAFAAMFSASAWGHYAIMTARGSTAALGFLFLPIYVVGAALPGYAAGRLLARWRSSTR